MPLAYGVTGASSRVSVPATGMILFQPLGWEQHVFPDQLLRGNVISKVSEGLYTGGWTKAWVTDWMPSDNSWQGDECLYLPQPWCIWFVCVCASNFQAGLAGE